MKTDKERFYDIAEKAQKDSQLYRHRTHRFKLVLAADVDQVGWLIWNEGHLDLLDSDAFHETYELVETPSLYQHSTIDTQAR